MVRTFVFVTVRTPAWSAHVCLFCLCFVVAMCFCLLCLLCALLFVMSLPQPIVSFSLVNLPHLLSLIIILICFPIYFPCVCCSLPDIVFFFSLSFSFVFGSRIVCLYCIPFLSTPAWLSLSDLTCLGSWGSDLGFVGLPCSFFLPLTSWYSASNFSWQNVSIFCSDPLGLDFAEFCLLQINLYYSPAVGFSLCYCLWQYTM